MNRLLLLGAVTLLAAAGRASADQSSPASPPTPEASSQSPAGSESLVASPTPAPSPDNRRLALAPGDPPPASSGNDDTLPLHRGAIDVFGSAAVNMAQGIRPEWTLTGGVGFFLSRNFEVTVNPMIAIEGNFTETFVEVGGKYHFIMKPNAAAVPYVEFDLGEATATGANGAFVYGGAIGADFFLNRHSSVYAEGRIFQPTNGASASGDIGIGFRVFVK